MIDRVISFEDCLDDSLFLWGARQTGKSTLLINRFSNSVYIDLLQKDVFERYRRRPSLLRENYQTLEQGSLIIIDEIQKLPDLLDEVHWLITRKGLRFILSGSSARKLKRSGANLLGGRALRKRLMPFVSAEIPDFDIIRAVNNGMIPRHYLVADATKRLQSYIGDYLQEEIKAEALIRNLGVFTRFLEVAALTNGEILNYTNIAQDCGVSAVTVKEYFSILEETLVGFMLPAYNRAQKRRVVTSPKFYYFDVGVANYLTHKRNLQPGSIDFGHSFEHFIIMELRAYIEYKAQQFRVSYWRTSSGVEVDVIISEVYDADRIIAIEIKSSTEIQNRHLKGLRAFKSEFSSSRLIVVSLEEYKRTTDDGIMIFPVQDFLETLWRGGIMP